MRPATEPRDTSLRLVPQDLKVSDIILSDTRLLQDERACSNSRHVVSTHRVWSIHFATLREANTVYKRRPRQMVMGEHIRKNTSRPGLYPSRFYILLAALFAICYRLGQCPCAPKTPRKTYSASTATTTAVCTATQPSPASKTSSGHQAILPPVLQATARDVGQSKLHSEVKTPTLSRPCRTGQQELQQRQQNIRIFQRHQLLGKHSSKQGRPSVVHHQPKGRHRLLDRRR